MKQISVAEFERIWNTPRPTCPACDKYINLEFGWIQQHKEPESSAICPASGTYLEDTN